MSTAKGARITGRLLCSALCAPWRRGERRSTAGLSYQMFNSSLSCHSHYGNNVEASFWHQRQPPRIFSENELFCAEKLAMQGRVFSFTLLLQVHRAAGDSDSQLAIWERFRHSAIKTWISCFFGAVTQPCLFGIINRSSNYPYCTLELISKYIFRRDNPSAFSSHTWPVFVTFLHWQVQWICMRRAWASLQKETSQTWLFSAKWK